MSQKIALVTGGSRGIGAAIAAQLSKEGCRVAATATSQSGADKITELLSPSGGQGYVLDVRDADGISQCLTELTKDFGSMPDILVNNAGLTRDNLLMRMTESEWDEVMDANLKSIFRLSKACIRPMIKKRFGRIISLSSVVGSSGNPGQTNYSAAKGAIDAFTRSLAREIGSKGVTVNTVAPGFINTDMTQALTESQRDHIASNIPLNRLGQPEDIAAGVAFLASDAAGYVTGQTLHINGGLFM